MFNVVGLEDGQLDGAADTVVGTQRGAFGAQPLTIDISLDGILVEVEVHIDQLVAHHIHVALQNHRLTVLVAFGGRLADKHIACFVDFGLQLMALTPLLKVFNHLLFVLRRAGNFVNLCKLLEY